MRYYGGSKDNVIAMEAHASLLAAPEDTEQILAMIRNMEDVWNAEFMGEEPGLTVKTETEKNADTVVFSKDTTQKVVGYLKASPNGLKEYSRKGCRCDRNFLKSWCCIYERKWCGSCFPDQKRRGQQKATGIGRSRCCDKSVRRNRNNFQRISGMAIQTKVRAPSGHDRSI